MTRAFKVNISAPSIIKDGGTSSQYLMADGSVKTGSATTSMNYAQTLGTKQTAISASGVTIVSVSITTGGNPVQVTVTGDAENSTAGGWIKLQLYRDSIAIGKIIHVEGSAGSENIPYALNVIDSPAAGTYTYSLKTASTAATGNFNFGETDGPVINAVELNTIVPSVNLILSGDLTANSIIKSGGTSSQFLKADGSIDSSAYLTSTTGVTTVNGSSGAITNVAKTDSANTFTGGVQQITTASAATKGLIVKGSASQTANLFEVQNSGGTVLGSIGSGGAFDFQVGGHAITSYNAGQIMLRLFAPSGQTANIQNWYVSNTIVSSIGSAGNISIFLNSASTVGLIVKGAASQTANLQEWQQSDASIPTAIDSVGKMRIRTFGFMAGGSLDVSTASTTNAGIVVRGVASQTADLQVWQDSTATALAQVTSGGFMNATGYRQIGGNTNAFGASTISGTVTAFGPGGNAAIIPVTIRGAASQTADLQQWQNSSGSVLGGVTAGGSMYVARGTAFAANAFGVSAGASTNVGIIVRGETSQTADLQQWQISTSAVPTRISANGTLTVADTTYDGVTSSNFVGTTIGNISLQPAIDMRRWTGTGAIYKSVAIVDDETNGLIFKTDTTATNTSATTERMRVDFNGTVRINGFTSGVQGLIIKGAASQTGNLTEWQNSAAAILASVGSTGTGTFAGLNIQSTGSSIVNIGTGASTYVGLTIKGVTSQTANLQEWRDSANTLMASLSPTGLFSAVSKSFDIPHPTKKDMRLRYGSLEGPENGVYVRGVTEDNIIELPEYWTGLVDASTITVSLTPVGKFQKVYVKKIKNNKVYVGGRVKEISYVIFGERKDTPRLTVEY